MPGLGFSGPNMAVVAYAEVDGVAGASTRLNSGVSTTRVSQGVYAVVLPTTLSQTTARDLIFVQLKQSSDGTGIVSKMREVENDQATTKIINVWSGVPTDAEATKLDSSFVVMVLRTTISPPTGAPA